MKPKLEGDLAAQHPEAAEEIASLHFDSDDPEYRNAAGTPRVDFWLKNAPAIASRINAVKEQIGADSPGRSLAEAGAVGKLGGTVAEVLHNAVREVDFESIVNYGSEINLNDLTLYLREQLGLALGQTLFLDELRHTGQESVFFYFLPVSQENADKLVIKRSDGPKTMPADTVSFVSQKVLARALGDLPFKAYALYLPTRREADTSSLLLVLAPNESSES
jgi:hypothetical protein